MMRTTSPLILQETKSIWPSTKPIALKRNSRAASKSASSITHGSKNTFAATRQQPCCPQLVRIAQILGLAVGQVYQPSLGLRRDGRFLARSRAIVKRHQRAISQRPFDTALNCLMVHTHRLPDDKERRVLMVSE